MNLLSPDSKAFSAMAVFAGIIESATPVSFRYPETSTPSKLNFILTQIFFFDLTGISQDVYRAAVRDGKDIDWQCGVCARPSPESYVDPSSYLESEPELTFADPDAESTRIEYSVDPEESSLHDPTPAEQSSSFAATYEIVENCSKRGRPKLIDSQGYTYNLQRQRGLVTDWQCSIRPKVNPCRATVKQRGDQFECGSHVHNHPAQVGALTAAKITVQVKAKAVEDIFRPAPAIVDEVM